MTHLPTQVSNAAHKTILDLETRVEGTEVARNMQFKVNLLPTSSPKTRSAVPLYCEIVGEHGVIMPQPFLHRDGWYVIVHIVCSALSLCDILSCRLQRDTPAHYERLHSTELQGPSAEDWRLI